MNQDNWRDMLHKSANWDTIAEQYADYISRHIKAVQEAGRQLGVSETQLAEHDRSKWLTSEFYGYARHFFGDKNDPDAFAYAWLHHIHHNPHHWQHFIFPDNHAPKNSSAENGVLEMPRHYALEMVADWIGAGVAITGQDDMSEWLAGNIGKIRLHSKTKVYVVGVLDNLGYADIVYAKEFGSELKD